MKFMVIEIARFGNESSVFDVYDTEHKGYSRRIARSADMNEIVDTLHRELRERPVDYLCVPGHGIALIFVDILKHHGVKIPILSTGR